MKVQAKRIAKAITAFVIGLSAWAAAALVDGKVTAAEWAQLLGVAAVAFGVFMVPNDTSEPTP